MRRKLIMLAVAMLATAVVFAQSKASSTNSKRWASKRQSPTIAAMALPTKVSGEGLLTPSGVRYWDIQTGEGAPAARGHVVRVLYTAWLDTGKVFDRSTSADKPTVITLGYGQVIRGWEEGMEGMKVGGKRQLRIPPDLAYGAAGAPPTVPPNSTLIFDVLLIGMD
jgi:FKBP-type peptidyl-prolyl cis-trans isomerase